MNIAERLKQIRHDKKITQQQLSDLTGLSRTTLANYERKGRQPNFETLNKIANAFNMSLIAFLQPCEDSRNFIFNECIETTNQVVEDKELEKSLSKDDKIESKIYDILMELKLENLFGLRADMNDLQKKIIDLIKFEAYKKINDIE